MRLRFRAPFTVTTGARTHLDTVLVRLVTADGTVGWGEASPDEAVTGESVDACAVSLRGVLPTVVLGVDVDHPDDLGALVDSTAGTAGPAARAAVDIAVHDAAARRAGLPLWRYLERRIVAAGGAPSDRDHLTVSRVVSMDAPDHMASVAATHVSAGFSTVKLKVGDPHDWRLDVERVAAVRARVGADVGIKVDVNQAWRTPDVAVAAVAALAASHPLFVEQPVDRRDLEGLASVRRQVPEVPVMADESVDSAADVERIVARGAADLVNLKLMRLGGLRAAIAADAVASAAGVRTQIGTMIESSVGSAAGLHLAMGLRNATFVEMGGPLMLADDPGDLARCYHGERVVLTDHPGLGITLTPGT